ncbi:unnamed protein product [Euphydryas editha]|uniref:HAT C-terminal dimerisation domain-containing protein n=1 Tax=Euphydryas editha TaxID=104508 RepID=A0AAU9UT47_EUPED|nr:unnamed protein product [Euphydryas editha]
MCDISSGGSLFGVAGSSVVGGAHKRSGVCWHRGAAGDNFGNFEKAQFWVKYLKVYPSTTEQELKLFLPFLSTYLCEKAFSAVVAIKTKYRSKLDIASDLSFALASIEPRIGNLVKNMQTHSSH